ncbi:hypothetical protein AERO9A_370186 [Aeromonas salmonicida]|nr:hypothetical protein AERO9A_370186 [Aeromonas salmonicida]
MARAATSRRAKTSMEADYKQKGLWKLPQQQAGVTQAANFQIDLPGQTLGLTAGQALQIDLSATEFESPQRLHHEAAAMEALDVAGNLAGRQVLEHLHHKTPVAWTGHTMPSMGDTNVTFNKGLYESV